MASDLESAVSPRRPGVVTFIGVIIYIQAFLALVAGVVLLAFHGRIADSLSTGAVEFSDGSVIGTAAGELIVGVLLLFVAAGIMRGSRVWRMLVTIVEAISMGFAVYVMIFHHAGGLLYQGLFALLVGIFVLWALWGHERSEEYFEAS